MSNTMWLVCAHHPDRTEAIQLGRRVSDGFARAPHAAKLDEFFEQHKLCGGGHDHFTVAFDRPKDWDLPTPAPVADAVHAALRDMPGASNDG